MRSWRLRRPLATNVEATQTPAYNPRSSEPARQSCPRQLSPPTGEPAKLEPTDSAAQPSGQSPSRSERRYATGRPEALPQPVVPPEPVGAASEKPSPAFRRSRQKSEVIIQIKPEEATAAQPPPPATPVAPTDEKKPEPKEHSAESAKAGPRTNKNSGVPFDPIKENGPIFVGWPKPKLALVITGNQEGYLEPCGCAGLDRMKGGMSRRYSLFRQLREERGWPVVGIDVGEHRQGFWQTGRTEVPDRRQRHEPRCATAPPRSGPSDLHLPTAEVMALTMPANAAEKDDVRLRQRRSVRLRRKAAAADAIDRGRLQDDRHHCRAGKHLHASNWPATPI